MAIQPPFHEGYFPNIIPSGTALGDLSSQRTHRFSPDLAKIREQYNNYFWSGYQDNRSSIIDENIQWADNGQESVSRNYWNKTLDNPFEIDPLVKYRMIGKSALDAFDDIGILSGPIPQSSINPFTNAFAEAPQLFFGQGQPLFQYGHGQLMGKGTATVPENPYLVATVGQGNSWLPRKLSRSLLEYNKENSAYPSYDEDIKALREYREKVGVNLSKLPNGEKAGFLQQYLSGDSELIKRLISGQADQYEIEKVLGSGGYYDWKGGMPYNYHKYLENPLYENETIAQTRPYLGHSVGAQLSEKIPYTKNYIPASVDLANRPFAVWEFGDKGFQLINEGNNKPLLGGVKPVPTEPISLDKINEFQMSQLSKYTNGGTKLSGVADALNADNINTTIEDIMWSTGNTRGQITDRILNGDKGYYAGGKNKPKSRGGFINPRMLGSSLASELATPSPFEEAMGMFAKKPTAEGAMNFAKYAKANPAQLAGHLAQTAGKLGAVAGMAMAPSQAMSRRDKLAYDFYSKPENQRLSKEEESKINAYLGVRAGLENVLDVGTLGVSDAIIHGTTPWWAQENSKEPAYEHEPIYGM